jgi:hypothetical protein
MNWKFWLTPAEPRPRYALLLTVGVVMMMTITWPIWNPGGPAMAAFVAVMAVIIAHVSAKMIMRP